MSFCVASISQAYTLESGETLVDPTKPVYFKKPVKRVAKAKPNKAFKLSMILNADNRRVAIINGKRVETGDLIQGVKVTDIRSDGVTMNENGKIYDLSLRKFSGISLK